MHADAAIRSTANGTAISAPEPMAYTIPEAALALAISERKVWTLVGDGTIESITIGRSRRIPRAGLLAYVESLRGVA